MSVLRNNVNRSSLVHFMGYECGNNRCGFEIKHMMDSSKVTNMHYSRMRKMCDRAGNVGCYG